MVVKPASDVAYDTSPAKADHIRTLAVIARRCLFMIVAFNVCGAPSDYASAPRLLVVLLACLSRTPQYIAGEPGAEPGDAAWAST